MNNKLSIIIAAYNVDQYIEKCINSCVHQDISPDLYEIIVVNDGSTDNTLMILGNLYKKIPNLKVVHQENSGLGASRNTGLKVSNSDYVWFIDGDDYLEENCLSGILCLLEKQKLDVLVMNYSLAFEENGDVIKLSNIWKYVNDVTSGTTFYASNYEKSHTWLFVFKRALFYDNCLFFKARINMQDSELLPKLMFHAKRVAHLNKVCYYYLQQNNSFTNTNNGQKRYNYFKSIIEVRKSLDEFSNLIENHQMIYGIKKKIELLHHVVFNHLVFFNYDIKWLLKIIDLLTQNGFYPLKYDAKGIMYIVKVGLNNSPVFTKYLIEKYQRSSSMKK